MMRYAICGLILTAIVVGAYYSGYSIGSRDIRIECANKKAEVVIQEKEVIKYVEREKDKIYSTPNADTNTLIRLFNEGKL
jgi:hypothetical protein